MCSSGLGSGVSGVLTWTKSNSPITAKSIPSDFKFFGPIAKGQKAQHCHRHEIPANKRSIVMMVFTYPRE